MPVTQACGTFQEYRELYLTKPQSKLQMFMAYGVVGLTCNRGKG